MMRPVYFYGAMSLDGYLSDEKDNLQWLFDTNLDGQSTYEAFEQKFDTLVMGRVTYETTLTLLGDGAPFYPGKEKVIFSQTKTGMIDEGRYVNDDPVTVVQALRQRSGSGIWIVGGGEILTALLTAGLVDDLWVQIAPVLLGRGKRLFPAGDYGQRLALVETTRMGELTELHLKRQSNGGVSNG